MKLNLPQSLHMDQMAEQSGHTQNICHCYLTSGTQVFVVAEYPFDFGKNVQVFFCAIVSSFFCMPAKDGENLWYVVCLNDAKDTQIVVGASQVFLTLVLANKVVNLIHGKI